MKRAVYSRGGLPLDVVELVDRGEPGTPRTGELKIAVGAASLHRGDLVGIELAVRGSSFSERALGTEGMGTVIQLGEGVEHFAVGDRVAAFPAIGSWSEQILVDASSAVQVPAGLSDEAASLMLVNTITAWVVLRSVVEARRGAAPDVPLVVTAAASGVGKFLLKGAADEGIPTVAVVRSAHSAGIVRDLFPGTPVVATVEKGWEERLRLLVPDAGLPAITEAHGGGFVQDILPFLAPGGTLVVWGDLAAEPWTITTTDLVVNQLKIRGVSIGHWMTCAADIRAADLARSVHVATERPDLFAVGGIFPLSQLGDAIGAVRATSQDGLTVIRPSIRPPTSSRGTS